MRGALMLLISVVGLPGLQNELGNLDGVEIMLKRFADSRAGANMRNDAVMILAKLCENHEDNQARLRRAHGVSLLIQEIDAYVKRRVPVTRARHKNLSEAARDAMPSSSSAGGWATVIPASELSSSTAQRTCRSMASECASSSRPRAFTRSRRCRSSSISAACALRARTNRARRLER